MTANPAALSLVTFNLHKGMSPLNRRHHLSEMALALQKLQPDLLFLQEVQGRNIRPGRAMAHLGQHDYLADAMALHASYGLNASYDHGHHGNAVLSRFDICKINNHDISVNRLEKRGILHVEILPPAWPQSLHCLCVHLNLLAHDRRQQYRILREYISQVIPQQAPLVLAGDFNDWRKEASSHLCEDVGLTEVFSQLHGRYAPTFPARMPLLCLDRVYVRGLEIAAAEVCRGWPWSHLSDHLPLRTSLLPQARA